MQSSSVKCDGMREQIGYETDNGLHTSSVGPCGSRLIVLVQGRDNFQNLRFYYYIEKAGGQEDSLNSLK
jgi:hypothetical protein